MQALTLAVETSTPMGSVALGRAQQLLAEIVIGETTRHSELLLPAIDQLFEFAGASRAQLGCIVVGGGPGSFTGLRVAAATAKGLAAALDVSLLAYSGLLAVAAGTGLRGRAVCTLFDARRNEVYAACYRIADQIETMMAPRVDNIEQVLADVEPASLAFAGDGALRHNERIAAAGGIVLPVHLAFPRAATLLWLAVTHEAAGQIADARHWEPDYLRASSAERGIRG